ncbi:MAG: S8 family peptidase [Planctomycetota bacterium]
MNKLSVLTLTLVAGAAAATTHASQPTVDLATSERAQVRVGNSMVDVVANGLDGASALVVSAEALAPDKNGLVAADFPTMTLTNRIVVETNDIARLEADMAPAQPGVFALAAVAQIAPHPTVRGFAVVEVGTVREALETAERLQATGAYGSVELDRYSPIELRSLPTDPLFSNQWHLRNTQVPLADVDAEAAWDMGYTGTGVTIGIVEGGFDENHPDLAPNYSSAASTGSNFGPTGHATACAGIAAARGNNGIGVVGLAYDAFISQQRYGSDSVTATAFTFRNDLNDVKSNSWGPSDNGWIWDYSNVERAAIEQATELGRDGLGTIITWAAGNGGLGDRVDYDPYASNRYTLAIGSAGDLDERAWYNELGSSMIVVTHSSGNNRGTVTTTTGNGYNNSFGGTSSACPLGAGAVALALEANPSLTWRDIQHLLIETARQIDPGSSNWTTNATGRNVSYDYGYGAIDAGDLVAAAETWVNVGPEVSAASGVVSVNTAVPDNNSIGITRTTTIDADITLEAVELVVSIDTSYRGDLDIILTAPSGTESRLATGDRSDPNDDLVDYLFTSLRHWGESSQGTWTLQVADIAPGDIATLVDFEVLVYGTESSSNCSVADIAVPFGVLDLSDTNAFIDAFVNGGTAADIAAPFGFIDLSDVDAYIAAFLAGCP